MSKYTFYILSAILIGVNVPFASHTFSDMVMAFGVGCVYTYAVQDIKRYWRNR